jgi:integrase
MVALAPPGLNGLRDRALLLLGFASAFRRSELVALDVADIAETATGVLVTIRRSKTDQDGEGVTIAITRGDIACPARALREWLDAAGIEAVNLSAYQQGRHGVTGEADRPVRCQYRQGLCRTRRLRRQPVLRPLAAVWFPNLSGGEGRIDFQDDGCLPSQVSGYPAGLCSGC